MARLAFDLSVLRVLLVEDDTFSRELELTALRQLGIDRITVAEDGALALDALKRGIACDLVVSDWNMPNFDGLQLFEAVRQGWPGTAFLMVTNTESLDDIRKASAAGVDGYLIKPFSLDKLRESIQLALIGKLTPGRRGTAPRPVNPELEEVTATIRKAIAEPAMQPNASGDPDTFRDAHKLAGKLSAQLNGFMGSLDGTGPEQLEVIRLHVDCMHAVLSGREDLLVFETRNLIVDGLSFAADLVSE